MAIIEIHTEQQMRLLGRNIASQLGVGDVVFLQGELGAGKTTLARGILQGLGCVDHVKSPTYTIVEPYQLNGHPVYHFDLYRLQGTDELCEMGVEDYFSQDAILLIEWADKASFFFPQPSLTCQIDFVECGRQVQVLYGRQVK